MDPWALVVDQGESVALYDFWRGTLTSTAGRLRCGGAAADTIGSILAAQDLTNGYAEATVETLSNVGSYAGVALRIKTATAYYLCSINGAGVCEIYLFNAGYSTLASVTITLPAFPFTIGGDMVEDKIRLFVNGKNLLVATDATHTGIGAWGTYMYAASAVTTVELGRWEAGPRQGPPSRRR